MDPWGTLRFDCPEEREGGEAETYLENSNSNVRNNMVEGRLARDVGGNLSTVMKGVESKSLPIRAERAPNPSKPSDNSNFNIFISKQPNNERSEPGSSPHDMPGKTPDYHDDTYLSYCPAIEGLSSTYQSNTHAQDLHVEQAQHSEINDSPAPKPWTVDDFKTEPVSYDINSFIQNFSGVRHPIEHGGGFAAQGCLPEVDDLLSKLQVIITHIDSNKLHVLVQPQAYTCHERMHLENAASNICAEYFLKRTTRKPRRMIF
jgi:hypothetical protein